MENLTGFRLWLSQKGRKRSTIRITLNSLRRVQRLGYSLDVESAGSYLFLLHEQGKSGAYINFYVNALRIYGQFIHNDPLTHLSYFKEIPRIKATMSDDEIFAFLTLPCPTCPQTSRYGKVTMRPTDPKRWKKMRVFWSICAIIGMRMGEVANLRVGEAIGDFIVQLYSSIVHSLVMALALSDLMMINVLLT